MDGLQITRAQDVELPQVVNLLFANLQADYQQGTQSSRRQTGNSVREESLDLPVVLTDDQGRRLADSLLFAAWVERHGFSFVVSRQYAHLEPTDVLRIGGHAVRITRRDEQPDGRIRFDAVAENPALYRQILAGAAAGSTSQSMVAPSPSIFYPMDIPLLRDADDDFGFYAAANGGAAADWPGCSVQKSVDGLAYTNWLGIANRGLTGSTVTTLANFSDNYARFDEVNTVRVRMAPGVSLSSVTEAALLADRTVNAFLVGAEIIRAKNCVLQGDSTYILSGFLRGLQGTDIWMASHSAAERVVKLTLNEVYRGTGEQAEVGVERFYKAITYGQSEGRQTRFTNSAAGKKPLPPVQLTRVGNTIQWVRRTRIGGEWLDYQEAALGESSERYEIDFLGSAGNVLATSTTTTPSITMPAYTAANYLPFSYPAYTSIYNVETDGTYLYGMSNSTTLRKINPASSPMALVGSSLSLAIPAGDVRGVAVRWFSGVSGTVYVVHPSALIAVTTSTMTVAATLAAAGGTKYFTKDIVYDGTNLWVCEFDSAATSNVASVKKLNATTLAVVASYTLDAYTMIYDSGFIYCWFGGKYTSITISSGALTVIIASPGTFLSERAALAANGVQYIWNEYAATLEKRAITTGAVQATIEILTEYDRTNIFRLDNLHADSTYVYAGGSVFDASSLTRIYAFESGLWRATACTAAVAGSDYGAATAPLYIEGVFSGALLANPQAYFPDSNGNAQRCAGESNLYVISELVRFSPGQNYTTAKVYQMSSTVGRGFPATITL